MTAVVDRERQRILMVGQSTPLTEGVHDLLQVVGYPVRMSSNWTETACVMNNMPPDLVIVDLSSVAPEVADRIRRTRHGSRVPILFLSLSGDDNARDLQSRIQKNGEGRLYFYGHTLLGMDELLDKIQFCMAGG
jgi:PleD family two-component response regulator